jgi:hypothetical protein
MFIAILSSADAALGLQIRSSDTVFITSEINDDVFASGGIIVVDAPVDSLMAAGGSIEVNAPVNGDLIVAGGQVSINSDVAGKIVAVGGNINIAGKAKNLIATGGNIALEPSAEIERDAHLSGGNVNHFGKVNGTLTVRAGSLDNVGESGRLDFKETAFSEGLDVFLTLISIIFTIGFFILGLVLIWMFPQRFMAVEERVRSRPILTTIIGFLLILGTGAVAIILAITAVGLPLAVLTAMALIIGLMLSTLFVSYTVGRLVLGWIRLKTKSHYIIYTVGFVILTLLFRVPIAGWFILFIAISLGYGAMYYAIRASWKKIRK